MENEIEVVGKEQFEKEVLKATGIVLVDFWAPWCTPCKMLAPILLQVQEESAGKLNVVKVNTEEPDNMPLAQEYKIMSIPNMKIFKNGEFIKEIIGYRTKDAILEELSKV
ncbi:thioredoxin [Candidatus Dojkabacteria bacterium CG_4_9_14_3_um_filter_150_Dojkabacteria_WS6_41_13]|uniref:Thioredoxin n=1 Tax=Candidatus Dojkabacteria bacterium CG_4_10_14_0_2_um_filter_Dojkabacteria_WS6_41_15 TaxID=2014249 RepID=A0A2M7W2I8_9BACT|nr:MAG: thioredoxin [Candidatus Dojkabacteria bacterium CG_4_10_14_3_um_filter_Dojkabacteria_WS6_41_9]PJA14957.1 MAG: thioredoxin [Candidatus Dojkabacteria bacterium CG_4_10_14_0_2_um_filter_Dojkabacteria_WS6_41_15]PJB22872.1 MAG: thioredoxin [Candidatus Dojkabacteria bacterium CG_4_9_14_3_um_filter_150_Dojkabacteria_WS6_41_13]